MCRFYSIRLWHSLPGGGANGHFARDPGDAIFNPRMARTKFQPFDFRWNLKDTDTE